MGKGNHMKKKKNKTSVADLLLRVIDKTPKSADEIRRELKDRFGHNVRPDDVRVNLLYLLRRDKIKRKKINKIYKYYI